jgi:hypothetical protein
MKVYLTSFKYAVFFRLREIIRPGEKGPENFLSGPINVKSAIG